MRARQAGTRWQQVFLEPNEFRDVVLSREAGNESKLILAYALCQVGRNASIEGAGVTRHDVDMKGTVH